MGSGTALGLGHVLAMVLDLGLVSGIMDLAVLALAGLVDLVTAASGAVAFEGALWAAAEVFQVDELAEVVVTSPVVAVASGVVRRIFRQKHPSALIPFTFTSLRQLDLHLQVKLSIRTFTLLINTYAYR